MNEDRPRIEQRMYHDSQLAEVRASYMAQGGFKVVGRYLDPERQRAPDSGFFVDHWANCEPADEAAA